jgi:serine/threonine-protein kinase
MPAMRQQPKNLLSNEPFPSETREPDVDQTDLGSIAGQKANRIEIGGCEIVKLIGEGGMGEVYEAWDPTIIPGGALHVAVKVLRKMDEDSVRRFINEARFTIAVRDTHIVGAYRCDVDRSRDQPYLVMEYVDGSNLYEILENRPFSVREATAIVIQVCQALDVAQRFRIVHRDVKPHNILLDRWGTAKLADLGLVKQMSPFSALHGSAASASTTGTEADGRTLAGRGMGTLWYVSPEQAEDATKADHRSDVYSLGCTFFHLLCRRAPFLGTRDEILEKHRKHPRPNPSLSNPDVPEGLAKVVEQMMAIDPVDRYQNAADVMKALQEPKEPERKGTLQGFLPNIATFSPLQQALIIGEILGPPLAEREK